MIFRTHWKSPIFILSVMCVGTLLSVPACASEGNGAQTATQETVTTQLRCGENQLLTFDKQNKPENIPDLRVAASDFAKVLPPQFKALMTEASKNALSQLTKYQDDQLSPITLVVVFNDLYLHQIDSLAGHYLDNTNGSCPYVMPRLLDIVRGRYGLAMNSDLSKWFSLHGVSSSDKMISALMVMTAQELAGKQEFSEALVLISFQ